MARSINYQAVGCFTLLFGGWAGGCAGKVADVGSNGTGGTGAASNAAAAGGQAATTESGTGGWCTSDRATAERNGIGGDSWHCLWDCALAGRAIPGTQLRQESQIQFITTDGERVYWSAIPADAEQSTPNAGTFPEFQTPLLAPNTATINSISRDLSGDSLASFRFSSGSGIPAWASPGMQVMGDRLYWIDRRDNHVWSCPKLDCTTGAAVGDSGNVTAFVVDSSALYWVSDALYRCDPTNCQQTTKRFAMLAPDLATAPYAAGRNLLADTSFLYLVENRRILKVPKDDSAPFTVVATEALGIASLTLHDSVLYWLTAEAPGALRKLGVGEQGNQSVTVASDIGAGAPCDVELSTYTWQLQSVAVEGDDVYFVLPAIGCETGRLYHCATSGCGGKAEVLAADPLLQPPIAVDAGHVYFAIGSTVPKPMMSSGYQGCYGIHNVSTIALNYLPR